LSPDKAKDIVYQAVENVLKVPVDFEPDEHFMDSGIFDSLNFILFVHHLEKQLPHKLPQTILMDKEMNSMNRFINFIAKEYE